MKKHDRKKEKKLAPEEQDIQNVERFKKAQTSDEKVKILSEISRDQYKLQALEAITDEFELYKYIAKLSEVSSILELLSRMKGENNKRNAFSFLVEQLKGNNSPQMLVIISILWYSINVKKYKKTETQKSIKCIICKLNERRRC